MNDGLIDALGHNSWASARLLEFCRGLTQAQLEAAVPGSYGSILHTFTHLLEADAFYWFALTGAARSWWPIADPDQAAPLTELEAWAADLTLAWPELLSRPFDADRVIIREGDNAVMRETRAGVILAQAIHHGSVHREQVNAILTHLGFKPPDFDVWDYGVAAGRNKVRAPG